MLLQVIVPVRPTFVWTNVIGVTLVALSIGYLAGGRLADRRPALDVILRLLLLACAYLLAPARVSR